jgi:predicted GTPase
MKVGAGVVAAQKYGAAGFVDPRPYTVGKIAETYKIYPNIGVLLPAMGYGHRQLKDLEATINNTKCDAVVVATPAGTLRVCGRDLPALSGAARDRLRADHLGIIFQQFNLLPFLGMRENVLLPCRFSRRRAQTPSAVH